MTATQVAWLNDPENVRYSEQRHSKHTEESQHNYLNSFPANSHIWLIKHQGRFDIGTISAHIDEHNRIANMGILIGKEHWGQGVGREAWSAVMTFLEKQCHMHKIEAGCYTSNRAMVRLALAAGMQPDGVRYDHFLSENGRPIALVHFAKFFP